ncbi:hypothetical protein CARUB_v10028486mg, partial [Capsella rubella]
EENVDSRDKISSLSNDLLIRILSLVSTREAVATMILSKRWRDIWTLVPKLEYNDYDEYKSISCYGIDIEKVVANAADRYLCKLDLELHWTWRATSLPKSLYTCKTLVEVNLLDIILVDVPSSIFLPSLKILRLFFVKFKDEDSFKRLVSSCSVLAKLTVFLGITDFRTHPFSMLNKFRFDVPHIFVLCKTGDKFLQTIPILSCLFVTLKDPMTLKFSGITTFSRLRSFKLFSYGDLWLELLSFILNNSPRLGDLYILDNGHQPGNLPLSWQQPSLVPSCLTSRLEVFAWKRYRASEEKKQVLRYILANSKCLKKVTITLYQPPIV